MPSTNVDLVRRAFEAFNHAFSGPEGGFDSTAFAEFASPDLEYIEDPKWPGAATYHGEAGFEAALTSQFEVLGEGTVEPDEIIDVGDGRVLSILRWRAKGTASEAVVEIRVAQVHTVRDGKIVRIVVFLDPAEGRRAVGL
jgi:ketosteroid isomerase-like protein